MRKFLALCVLVLGTISCKKEVEPKLKVDVSNIKVNVNINRFDIDFYKESEKGLNELKEEYPLLFPLNVHDSIWLSKRVDKDEQELFNETQLIFNNINELELELTSLFKHVKYYNPKFISPKVITMLTNIDYDNRIIYQDSLMLISLDSYLGKNHEFYNDYPEYVKQNNKKENVIVDAAIAIINKQMYPSKSRRFIDKMIYKGKKMYLLDAYLPNVLDENKIGYSKVKFDWAVNNEEEIWKYFIEKDILYSTNKENDKRFLNLAPFSKFYMEGDNQSPGRVGEWVGWQIVRSYMQKNDVSLRELLQRDEETIFKESKYKPKR
ncbi:gliding motility lipoprotein GldB [uncultured Tenacibaculum sp.]|uniref:gliding motility lipoprotein GldB n=1 Tax=uncultured Tenacibaculum sp. TaxID=174713 RepID=UPI0026389CBF|nr:gliding motility lipoprotein GldB [uncultured Tenacibaculum sp.]